MSVQDAVNDLNVLVSEIVENVGKKNVIEMMTEDFGWIIADDVDDIPEVIRGHILDELDPSDVDAVMEEIYSDFYNIAARFDYEIKTSY